MGVRPFVRRDIPEVSDLHRRVIRTANRLTPQMERAYESYFRTVFLENPDANEDVPSLVYDNGGTIAGFLGVTPKRMMLRDRPVLAAVSSQFIVDPAYRSSLAAVQLLKDYFNGPQELSVTDEANDQSRHLWQILGGKPICLNSIYWVRIFRPAEFMLSRLSDRAHMPKAATLARPALRLADGIATVVAGRLLRPPQANEGDMEDPPLESLAIFLEELCHSSPLRPVYETTSLQSIWKLLARDGGMLRKRVIRDRHNRKVGCFVYRVNPGGVAEVLQVGARPGGEQLVLSHLMRDAWEHRAAALSGRLQTELLGPLREQNCLLCKRSFWMLAHARDPEVLQPLLAGNAVLSRLEGEYPSHFQPFAVSESALISSDDESGTTG